jgi:hypothetical protein
MPCRQWRHVGTIMPRFFRGRQGGKVACNYRRALATAMNARGKRAKLSHDSPSESP